MIDIVEELAAIQRETGPGAIPAGEGRTVALTRDYRAELEDVWDAITDPVRIARWFLPVTGELTPGGRYQLHGNAGGEILRCEPPRLLLVTWVFGEDPVEDDISELEVTLTPAHEGHTRLRLAHTAVVGPERWAEYGPGAVGVGWDLTLLGLGLHLRGESIGDPREWEVSPEARQFIIGSSAAWGEANEASGADGADAAQAVVNTTAFYAPEPESAEEPG